ncbi:DUF6517 family protein [Haloarchaeobius amylolyticus]|uniref:DUF6517 family protein n=1 Tax=Haloarchaeobius amylolyticus TaxID=1198296 RepID=UPI00226D59D8|nr:DUF6517 family protein [Haloarchaeobius amylolyticus]
MRFSRRGFLAATTGGLAATSGCLDTLLGGDQSFEASAAEVGQAALDETSYRHLETTANTISQTFEIRDTEKTVTLTNYISTYQRMVDIPGVGEQPGAVFATLSTPKFEVLGRTLNPIAEVKKEELAKRAQDTYGSLRVEEQLGTQQVDVLGGAHELATFAGVAELASTQFDVTLDLGTVPHEKDIVVLFGGYPAQLQQEAENVLTMVRGVTH